MMEKISLNQFSVMQLRYTLNLSPDEMLIKKNLIYLKLKLKIYLIQKRLDLLLDPRAISQTEMGYPFP